MATLMSTPSTNRVPGTAPISSSSSLKGNPLLLKPSQVSLLGSSAQTRRIARKALCKAAKNDANQNESQNPDHKTTNKVDRRNMLLGLGGLYGAAATTLGGLNPGSSMAVPAVLDLKANCERALKDPESTPGGMKCCPPTFKENEIINFDPRNYWSPGLRVRPAAHRAHPAYVAKFQEAMRRMKALPDDDPRSFAQQAKIHCAYCNGSYHQQGAPNDNDHRLQVHNSWLFLPFHRAYLFFFERILGSLINDPGFAIPYWNWDHPDGMYMPSIYTEGDLSNPLYDEYRNENHQGRKLIDLGYSGEEDDEMPEANRKFHNLWHMHVHVVRPKEAELFMGGKYVQGDVYQTNSPGSIERIPHIPVHAWVGDQNRDMWEDMGSFYSAGRDPLFYAHHANVDRIWTIWKLLDGGRKEFPVADWLDNYFIFYDERKRPVRIYVRDMLDDKRLGYVYEFSETAWVDPMNAMIDHKPLPVPPAVELKLPRVLGETGFRTKIARPKPRKNTEEILEISVKQKDSKKFVKFDVFLHDEHHHFTPDGKTKSSVSYAGSYTELASANPADAPAKVIKMPVSEVIKMIGAENDDYVNVAFITASGGDAITITDIKLTYL